MSQILVVSSMDTEQREEFPPEPVNELHHTCHDPSCKDPNHWRVVHPSCNNKEAGRQGQREIKSPRARLGIRHYRDTILLLRREQKGLCWLCGKPGTVLKQKPGNKDGVQKEKEREKENLAVAGLHDPLVAEIEIGTTLRPWYWDWLIDHTGPGKAILTFNQAIYVANRDAIATFGYGAAQTIREYLKGWTTPNSEGKSPFRVDRSDTAVGKHIVRGKWP